MMDNTIEPINGSKMALVYIKDEKVKIFRDNLYIKTLTIKIIIKQIKAIGIIYFTYTPLHNHHSLSFL